MEQAKIKILFMDDEDYIRDVAEQMLVFFGYEVTMACDGQEALKLYADAFDKGEPHDLVILDMSVPSGWGAKKTVDKIIALDMKACVLVSSGYMADPVIQDFKRYGFSGTLPKPYEIEEVDLVIKKMIELVGQRIER